MTTLLSCWGYVAVSTLAAPLLLTRGHWHVWYPRTALALWHLVILSGAGVLLFSLVHGVVLAAGASYRDGSQSWGIAVFVGAWIAMALLGVLISLFLATSELVLRADQRKRIELEDLLVTGPFVVYAYGDLTVREIDSHQVLATSCLSPEPTIVITTGLRRLLSRDELEAVLVHERTHLTQRHHMAVLLAQVNASCFPWLPSARRLRSATVRLVEFIADDRAARVCGVEATSRALDHLAATHADAAAAARAARLRADRHRRPAAMTVAVPIARGRR